MNSKPGVFSLPEDAHAAVLQVTWAPLNNNAVKTWRKFFLKIRYRYRIFKINIYFLKSYSKNYGVQNKICYQYFKFTLYEFFLYSGNFLLDPHPDP